MRLRGIYKMKPPQGFDKLEGQEDIRFPLHDESECHMITYLGPLILAYFFIGPCLLTNCFNQVLHF